jgi:hypothetical protein
LDSLGFEQVLHGKNKMNQSATGMGGVGLAAEIERFPHLQSFAARYRGSVRIATHQDFELLEEKISNAEKEELGSTWRRDWRAELHSTRKNSLHAFVGSIEGVEGFLVFGATRVARNVCLIWMLQTASFADSARNAMGHRISFMLRGCVQAYTAVLLDEYAAVFNVIAKRYVGNIRWLRQQKLDFYESPDKAYEDFLMFGKGRLMPRVASDIQTWKGMLGCRP